MLYYSPACKAINTIKKKNRKSEGSYFVSQYNLGNGKTYYFGIDLNAALYLKKLCVDCRWKDSLGRERETCSLI